MRRSLLLVVSALLVGCHSTFRRALPDIQTVNAQAFTTTPPHARLGRINDPTLLSAPINSYQGIQEARVEQRLRDALEPTGVTGSLVSGFGDALGSGPPFAFTTRDDADATVQIEVLSYGMEVPWLGAQGVFEYRLRVRAYRSDGRRIYSARATCSNAVGAPRDVAAAFGTVNNTQQLERMSDAQVQSAFDKVAEWCGWEVVRKMRVHGS